MQPGITALQPRPDLSACNYVVLIIVCRGDALQIKIDLWESSLVEPADEWTNSSSKSGGLDACKREAFSTSAEGSFERGREPAGLLCCFHSQKYKSMDTSANLYAGTAECLSAVASGW